MKFLPTTINGKRPYAGFWVRFGAAIVDTLVLLPLAFGFYSLQHLNFTLAIIITFFVTGVFAIYNIYFNAIYGGTLGKLSMGIRVTKPNGGKIGWREAWYRSSIDLAFAALFLILELVALFAVEWNAYQVAAFFERIDLLESHYPDWYKAVDTGNSIWVWGELVVLLLNDRKRAIHDYIAGTVVIHKEFAEQAGGVGPLTAASHP